MTKEELIARLKTLGEQLGRDVSLTGPKEELAQRVIELEEELADDDADISHGDESEKHSEIADLVAVVALAQLHTRNGLTPAGTVIRLAPEVAKALIARRHVRRL